MIAYNAVDEDMQDLVVVKATWSEWREILADLSIAAEYEIPEQATEELVTRLHGMGLGL